MTLRLTGSTPMPWVKLWREEAGSFSRLPLYARAFAAELLKFVDRNGQIDLGEKVSPAQALAYVMRAHPRERRRIVADVDGLIADRFIEIKNGVLSICNWARWQTDGKWSADSVELAEQRSRDDVATVDRWSSDGTSMFDRQYVDGTPMVSRRSTDHSPKCAESLNPVLQERELEGDLELEKEHIRAHARDGSETKRKKSPRSKAPPNPDVNRVFEFWKSATGRTQSLFTDARARLISKALAGFDVTRLESCIANYATDEWHRSVGKLELEYMLRDVAKIESGLNRKRSGMLAPTSAEKFSGPLTEDDKWLGIQDARSAHA